MNTRKSCWGFWIGQSSKERNFLGEYADTHYFEYNNKY